MRSRKHVLIHPDAGRRIDLPNGRSVAAYRVPDGDSYLLVYARPSVRGKRVVETRVHMSSEAFLATGALVLRVWQGNAQTEMALAGDGPDVARACGETDDADSGI